MSETRKGRTTIGWAMLLLLLCSRLPLERIGQGNVSVALPVQMAYYALMAYALRRMDVLAPVRCVWSGLAGCVYIGLIVAYPMLYEYRNASPFCRADWVCCW